MHWKLDFLRRGGYQAVSILSGVRRSRIGIQCKTFTLPFSTFFPFRVRVFGDLFQIRKVFYFIFNKKERKGSLIGIADGKLGTQREGAGGTIGGEMRERKNRGR